MPRISMPLNSGPAGPRDTDEPVAFHIPQNFWRLRTGLVFARPAEAAADRKWSCPFNRLDAAVGSLVQKNTAVCRPGPKPANNRFGR